MVRRGLCFTVPAGAGVGLEWHEFCFGVEWRQADLFNARFESMNETSVTFAAFLLGVALMWGGIFLFAGVEAVGAIMGFDNPIGSLIVLLISASPFLYFWRAQS